MKEDLETALLCITFLVMSLALLQILCRLTGAPVFP